MDGNTILAAIHAAGLDRFLPILLFIHATASALDALIPQPKPGSHWLPFRLIVSFIALNFGNASNWLQPSVKSWLQRVVVILASRLPPPGPKPTILQRAVLFLAALVPPSPN